MNDKEQKHKKHHQGVNDPQDKKNLSLARSTLRKVYFWIWVIGVMMVFVTFDFAIEGLGYVFGFISNIAQAVYYSIFDGQVDTAIGAKSMFFAKVVVYGGSAGAWLRLYLLVKETKQVI